MTQYNEAIARYNRILEADPYKDLAWADALLRELQVRIPVQGKRISPVLRPHFITQRQYSNLVKATESLNSALDRIEKAVLSSPALLSRMEMLPAEKMLASVDPGYSHVSVTSLLDAHLNNGTLQVVGCNSDLPSGVLFGEALNNLFYDAPPVQEFRKRYPLTKVAGSKPLLDSILKAYREFGGKKKPNVAIMEVRQLFQNSESGELSILAEMFRKEGFRTEIITPDQLEYREGALIKGDFRIDVIYRRMSVAEFLVRFDLNHSLVRAYQDRAVCVVNSFRSEISQKRAIFDLLTDETVTAEFPSAERKAIRDFLPWTRRVVAGHATYHENVVDLPEFISAHREQLVLKPNDDDSEKSTFTGASLDSAAWDRALKTALRDSYVVQEVGPSLQSEFPLYRYGSLEMREMNVDVHPHSFLGKVHGCSTWVTPTKGTGFSTVSGLAPTFILDSK